MGSEMCIRDRRRASQDLFEQLKTIDATATPEAFQLKRHGDCIGWDYAKLVKRLGGYHLFMKAKRPTLTITGPEATSLIAQMWNKLPPPRPEALERQGVPRRDGLGGAAGQEPEGRRRRLALAAVASDAEVVAGRGRRDDRPEAQGPQGGT